MVRDARAGAIMPDGSPASRRTFAAAALGLDDKPVFTLEQSAGHLVRVLGSLGPVAGPFDERQRRVDFVTRCHEVLVVNDASGCAVGS